MSLKTRTIRGFATFFSVLVIGFAAVVANADTAQDHVDETVTNAKEAAREKKSEVKKGVRDATGHGSKWEDTKDSASDAKENLKDEAGLMKKKLKR